MREVNDNLRKNVIRTFVVIFGIIIFTVVVLILLDGFSFFKKDYYKASDFDKDKIDDYTDLVFGARIDAENHPNYISKYYEDAYPPDDEGVCTDTIWRAFKNAGYSLRDMVDNDIKKNPDDYPNIKKVDNKIDFRRVVNLEVFFKKYAIELTLEYEEIEEWQPGDIVVFGEHKHIGIISDKRNEEGIPYVIHNSGQQNREEDYLTRDEITGHYRFDASKIDEALLIKWED